MGLFKIIFGSNKLESEKKLEELYFEKLKNVGISRRDIKSQINKCKDESSKQGTDNLPEKYGDFIIEQAKLGNEHYKKIIYKAILGGANEDDIKEWWNLSELERRMIIWEDTIFRIATFKSLQSSGFSFEECASKIRKSYPLYGDQSDESNTQGDDRPLPNELHCRINRMTADWAPFYVQQFSPSYNTMNDFIRDELIINKPGD